MEVGRRAITGGGFRRGSGELDAFSGHLFFQSFHQAGTEIDGQIDRLATLILVNLDGLARRVGQDPAVRTRIDVVFQLLAFFDADRFVQVVG